MYINLPNNFTKRDIKELGRIYKEHSYRYILSDIKNRNIKNTLELKGQGFFNYIVNISDTYLFLIGNQIANKDINPKKIDYLSKIIKFEYLLINNSQKIKKIDIPNRIFTITTKERWLTGDITSFFTKDIESIIEHKKIHLQACENPYIKYMMYLCDDTKTNFGLFKHGFSKNILHEKYVLTLKDTEIDGYIIKTEHSKFIKHFY